MNATIPLILMYNIHPLNLYSVFIDRFGGLSNLLGKQIPDDGNGPKHVGAS
jgi:hypothetical protein